MDERDAWVVLASVDGVGGHTFARLLALHGGAARTLERARTGRLPLELTPTPGPGARLRPEVHVRICESAQDPTRALARLVELGVWTITTLDAGYPSRLRILDPPPPVVFGWGEPAALGAARAVAMVGTRRPTPHGRATAAAIAKRLVESGASVVSGLAVGIDGVAQATAVEEGGVTVGVLGSGHAHPGPRAHRALVRTIVAQRGAVISELAPDATATRGTFPRRNRLISALADAVIVVEAPIRSGALITARHALEQGREVYAAPGRLGDDAAAGCLALLRETPARIVAGVDELLADLSELASGARNEAAFARGPVAGAARLRRVDALQMLGAPERSVADAICHAPRGLDGLVAQTGMAPGTVAAALTLLQLRGWIQQIGATYLPAGALLE